jgi:hypothetical protein
MEENCLKTTFVNPCPLLPQVEECYRATTHPCPQEPSAAYPHRLRYAQSRWLENKPAQALLQLNHAFTVDLPDDSPGYAEHSWPYAAKLWIARNASAGDFLGNPVRHYQHYATRLPSAAPRREIRAIRSWLCFHLMQAALPADSFPPDEFQIENESLTIPEADDLLVQLEKLNRPAELAHVRRLLETTA